MSWKTLVKGRRYHLIKNYPGICQEDMSKTTTGELQVRITNTWNGLLPNASLWHYC